MRLTTQFRTQAEWMVEEMDVCDTQKDISVADCDSGSFFEEIPSLGNGCSSLQIEGIITFPRCNCAKRILLHIPWMLSASCVPQGR